MKSPTSLIRIRYAVGVMLTLSAVFAVVLTAISVPSDETSAQTTDPVEERAKAWWALLSNVERLNVLQGKEADHDTATAAVRDLGDPTRTNIDPAVNYDENGNPVDTGGTAGVEYSAVEQAQKDYADQTTANQDAIKAIVDGVPTNGSGDLASQDLYAVGDHLGTNIEAFSGFQSVQVWWDHTSCQEVRISVGEDNDALVVTGYDDPFTTDVEPDPETSAFCGMFDELTSDQQARVNEIGQAILGLDTPESTLAPRGRDAQWWNMLDAREMVNALYGSDALIGDPTRTDTDTNPFTRPELAQKMYADLDADTKALVTDRWRWIYDDGGRNEMGISRIVYWWDNIGCDEMRISVGADNNGRGVTPPAPADFCSSWDGLNDAASPTDVGQQRQADVFELGYAIVFPNNDDNPVPDVGAWWNTLNADQMVYVVYGNPPLTSILHDHDDDATTAEVVREPTMEEKAVFQKMYDGLADDDGIRVEASASLNTHLPAYVVTMLERNGIPATPTDGPDANDDTTPDYYYYSAKAIVNALANEIFDPPTQIPDGYGGRMADGSGTLTPITDDMDFDWPYTPVDASDDLPDNLAATVADWWERTDCRVMRIAVGEDNDYLDPADVGPDGNADTDDDVDAETPSIYCRHFPGHDTNDMNDLSPEAQKRVVIVGAALLGLTAEANGFHAGRPSFNEPATGTPTIGGVAQVGSTLTSNANDVADTDTLGDFSYQWLRDGEPISGATQSSYELQPDDVKAAISVRYSFTDGGRYYEMRVSNATSTIAGSPGEVSRIEPAIRSVTVSGGDVVQLAVDVYGLQNAKDNSLGANFEWSEKSGDTVTRTFDGDDDNTRELDYTAPSSPGTYTVTATLGGGQCQPADEDDRDTACSATIVVQVRRPAAPVAEEVPPVDPPGDIPAILTDSDGNQYEVITPVEGGTFDAGEGYSIHVPSGAVPNGEFIGIRMSAEGEASNVGMSHQRYTLGGDSYGIHVVDGSGATVSSTELEDPARVCVPLPDALRTRISDLALVGLNSDGTLTVYAANVRLGDNGTQVCGNVSGIPATVAVGSQGAPAPLPTEVPPEDLLPETGATAPSSNGALFALILGIAVVSLGALATLGRRRNRNVSR